MRRRESTERFPPIGSLFKKGSPEFQRAFSPSPYLTRITDEFREEQNHRCSQNSHVSSLAPIPLSVQLAGVGDVVLLVFLDSVLTVTRTTERHAVGPGIARLNREIFGGTKSNPAR